VGRVLVDAGQEETYPAWEALVGPTRWAEMMDRAQQPGEGLEDYPDFERLDVAGSVAQGRQARANQPLRPMPLAVLTHGRPFEAPFPEWPGEAFERMWLRPPHGLGRPGPKSRLPGGRPARPNIHGNQPAPADQGHPPVVPSA